MKRKIKLLIITSILGLIALSIIQGYLINNTYKLKKDAFIGETRRSISQIDDSFPALDSLADVWQEHFLDKLSDYKYGLIKKERLVAGLEYVFDSINPTYRSEYQKALLENNIPYGIKFHKRVTAIILLDSIKNDTLFSLEKKSKPIILGDDISKENSIGVSTTVWQTDHTSSKLIDGEVKEIVFNLMFQAKDEMDIDGWKKIVFKRMLGLLLLSFIIFSTVIGLLFYSIKSLITQKKIADIKTDFVNNITHELKTPLATLTLATKMLKKQELKQQPLLIDNTINTIERQNKRLQKLIDQVLNNSLGYREISLQKETINIAPYINTIIDDFLLSVTNKDVTIDRDFNITQETMILDKFYITTALLNILENAVKYNSEPVVISFKTKSKTQLEIRIVDNGIGISDKDQKQIFEKFFRVGNKEIHDVKGLGLGLYYTNQIIKAHGGHIKLDSKLGKGSTFILTIPFN